MSFRRNFQQGELLEAKQLYNDLEISEEHTPLYRRRGYEDSSHLLALFNRYKVLPLYVDFVSINRYRVLPITSENYRKCIEATISQTRLAYDDFQSVGGTDLFPFMEDAKFVRLKIDGQVPEGDYLEFILFKIGGEYKIGPFAFQSSKDVEG